jgi:hypothetical protein
VIVVRIDEQMSPELKAAISKLMEKFNVVGFGPEEGEAKQDKTVVRSGQTGQDLSTAVSAAIDQVKNAKPHQ